MNRLLIFHTLSITFLLTIVGLTIAQETETKKIGILVYFEGRVELQEKAGGDWSEAKIEQKIYNTTSIKTGPNATAEIRWNEGKKTVVGPSSNQDASKLLSDLNNQTAGNTQSMWKDFKRLFESARESENKEVGGIRRSKVEAEKEAAPDQLYWKQMKEVTFNEASQAYENEYYRKAITLLHTYLQQHPKVSNAKFALFALGHSYVELNNYEKAVEIFREFTASYPNDELTPKAEDFLNKADN